MNKTISIIIIFSMILFTGCVDMSAEQIAKEVQEKYESIEDYRGTVITSTSFEGQSMQMEADFMYKMPENKFKQEIKTGKEAGSIVVSNGKTMWSYYPRNNEVVVMELLEIEEPGQVAFGDLIQDMLEKNDVKLLGSDKIDGRNTQILEVVPRNNDMIFAMKQKMWIDEETWMPLRIEIFDNEDKMITSMEYRNVEFNTGIPDSEFEFEIPVGAKVINQDLQLPQEMTLDEAKQEVDFAVAEPGYLPEGYILDRVTISKINNIQSVSITYNQDDEILFIHESNRDMPDQKEGTESVKINDIDAAYMDTYFGKSLSWTWGNTAISINGRISKEELIKVAESMK